MKRSVLQRIVGLNLAILVVSAAVLRLANSGNEGGFTYALEMAILIGVMLLVNVGFGFNSATKAERQAHWLSFLLVLLIGFGLCGAGLTMQR